MSEPLHLLLVEDSDEDAQLVIRELDREGYKVVYERVETAQAFTEALSRRAWDVILCDYSLPQFDAPHALEALKESGHDLPFIIISGTIGEETAVMALKAGAHDFLIKGNYARLGPAIERERREAQIRQQRRQALKELQEKERLLSESQRIGHVGSWSYDISTNALHCSDEMYRLLNISPFEFEGDIDGLLVSIHADDRPAVAGWIEALIGDERQKKLDFRVIHDGGELRYIQGTGAPLHDATGEPARILGTAQDITERKLAEIQIRQQIARLTALRKIDQAITSSFDLYVTLNILLLQTLEQLGMDAADILLLNPDGVTLRYAAGQGFRKTPFGNATVSLKDTLAGQAVLTRQLIQILNLKDQPHVGQLPEEFICYFSVPLITKNRVNGVLEVYHRTAFQPQAEWIDFLEALAGQAAIAVDNAMLFENLQRSNLELELAYNATIEGWSRALDLRDRETEGHTKRVTEMTMRMARIMNIPEEKFIHIHRGGLLHDIGKMGVPDSILLKPAQLTDEERDIMRQHPKLAYHWLSPITFLRQALEIPYCHHEKWNGTGYPRGLKGEEIPIAARIFAIVDVWDALTNDRPYRSKWDKDRTIEYMRGQGGIHFDPNILDIFLENLGTIAEA
jgi:PAS domain S-box-containing protein